MSDEPRYRDPAEYPSITSMKLKIGDESSVVMATICVDSLMHVPASQRVGGWRWSRGCHLFVKEAGEPQLAELHRFAGLIGMKRKWFQGHQTVPHYDLNESRRRAAVERGALEVDRRQTVEAIREWRAWAVGGQLS